MINEVNMKERVVGGLVLAMLALILIVMILSGQDEPQAQTKSRKLVHAIHLPQQQATRPRHKQLRQRVHQQVAPQSVLDMVERAPRVKSVKVKPRPRKVKKKLAAVKVRAHQRHKTARHKAKVAVKSKKVAHKPLKVVKSHKKQQKWIIQLASFRNKANARGIKAKLRRKGYKVVMKTRGSAKSKIYTIQVGPLSSKIKAQATIKRLQKAVHLKGVIRSYRG